MPYGKTLNPKQKQWDEVVFVDFLTQITINVGDKVI